ncbi:5315_t:CDS:2 [Ambispora gerdemannii]|uniref:5315_t:CDS:1 n=1 Tax=Ambispora gerdemannii TaxID=144530 RepID=A0A9N9F510_9GLOM|nr:5315_t:CDS:2 [Ambispora gerdemannii]
MKLLTWKKVALPKSSSAKESDDRVKVAQFEDVFLETGSRNGKKLYRVSQTSVRPHFTSRPMDIDNTVVPRDFTESKSL